MKNPPCLLFGLKNQINHVFGIGWIPLLALLGYIIV